MRDCIGNTLEEGSLVLWLLSPEFIRNGLQAKVLKVEEPKVELGGADRPRNPRIYLQIVLTLDAMPHGTEGAIPAMYRIVDPEAQAVLDRALGGKPS